MRSIFLFLVLMLVPACAFAALEGETQRLFVEELLVAGGLDRVQAKSIMQDRRITVNPDIVIKNLFHSSPKGTAKKPDIMEISPLQIQRAKLFMGQNAGTLSIVEKRFGVSPRIITAILLIESRLGTYKMSYNVASAYANLAFMLDPSYRKEIQALYAKDYPQLEDQATMARAQRKARWAVQELVYLAHLANHLNMDPLTISGSFAGAMGPGQFIPSSFWIFGMDANGDDTADPSNMADANLSMGNYLRNYGWREDASEEEKRKAIWYYNHSDVYVNTVMAVYEKLR